MIGICIAHSPFLVACGVLQAWAMTLRTMYVGELCEVIATAPFCYGETGSERLGIAPGECLQFELELLSWKVCGLARGQHVADVRTACGRHVDGS